LEIRQHGPEYLAPTAYFHFLGPAFLHLSSAECSVDKPANMSGSKFPRRTVLLGLGRALTDHPTGLGLFAKRTLQDQKQKQLAFRVQGNVSPALLETLNGFGRRT